MRKILAFGLLLTACAYSADLFPVQLEAIRYPALANQARIEGLVRLTLSLDDKGGVSHVEIVSGHKLLAPAAEENIKLWKFAPLCSSKQKETRTLEFTYDFRLDRGTNPETGFRYEHPYRVIAVSRSVPIMPSLEQKSH